MDVMLKGRPYRLPDFLLVGAARSGTTSLYHYLAQHPRIFLPGAERAGTFTAKEPFFFSFSGRPTRFRHPPRAVIWRLDEYASLFEPAGPDQILGEASAIYLPLFKDTIRNIKRHLPEWQQLRIIAILRDPVERAFSMYAMHHLRGEDPLDFEEAMEQANRRTAEGWAPWFDYVGFGFYYEQVKAYVETFRHVKVCLFEDLLADSRSLVQDLYRFLGVDDTFAPDVDEAHNPTGVPRSGLLQRMLRTPGLLSSRFPLLRLIPLEKRVRLAEWLRRLNLDTSRKLHMRDETRERLKLLFRDDILQLQDLIGRDLSGWIR